MSSWPKYEVTKLQQEECLLVEDGNHGEYRPRRAEFTDDGVVFIRASDMEGGRVLFESASHINDIAFNRIRKGVGAPGDVILSHKGTVGKVARVPLDCPEFVCSPQTTFWRTLNDDFLDRRFLYYFMRSPFFQRQLDAFKNETDMAGYVSLTNQRTLKVPVPPIELQRSIGDILGDLDGKIDLNRQMNETLEAMARTIFKSWFVDFDPVHAKAQGEAPAGMTDAIAELFPDSFVESELGPIPEGWRVVPAGKAVSAVGGTTPRTKNPEYWEGGVHYFATPKHLSDLSSPILLGTDRKVTDKGLAKISSGLLPIGTVLLSSRAPVGYLALTAVPVCINQGFIAMICDKIVSNYYMLNWAVAHMHIIEGRASGTTFAEVSKRNFRKIKVLVPNASVVRAFDSIVAPMYKAMEQNMQESRTLANLRDTLLPKLISGELRVPGDQTGLTGFAG